VSSREQKGLPPQAVKALAGRFGDASHQEEIHTVRDMLKLALDSYAEVLHSAPRKRVLADTQRRIQELERKNRILGRTIERLNAEISALQSKRGSMKTMQFFRRFFT
jgi:hypothetical protein